jgi:hypothetical protein
VLHPQDKSHQQAVALADIAQQHLPQHFLISLCDKDKLKDIKKIGINGANCHIKDNDRWFKS